MDRRVFLAIVLAAIVIVVTPMLFPGATGPVARDTLGLDSAQVATRTESGSTAPATVKEAAQRDSGQQQPGPLVVAEQEAGTVGVGDTLAITSPHMKVWYSSRFGTPLRVGLTDYLSRSASEPTGPVQLQITSKTPLLQYRAVFGDTTLFIDHANLSGVPVGVGEPSGVNFQGTLDGHKVLIEYGNPTKQEDRYLIHVLVKIDDAPATGQLVVDLPRTLESAETDTVDDIRHLAFGYKVTGGDVESVPFAKLDSGQTRNAAGPLVWVAVRDKYFLFALIAPDSSIASASFTGAARVAKLAPKAKGSLVLPMRNGRAAFDIYTGPQEFERLRSVGYDMDRVNPYAGWFHAIVQPFATAVTWVLLWMKHTSGLGYGWVIIIFGVTVRLLLWPLNQSAMRTSIRMQRLQPELAEVQRKYKSDPEKQREALVKLYQAHGMTPFSPMMGCLPMMLPMPILFALYFVFLNTIEFRGVSFLWMHDISAADPYYITPLVMGLSMFALSWIGMRGTPPTTQTRMMSYMMPVMLTVMFFRFAAGLNLYYAVQNLAAIPQQWLLARERAGLGASTGGKGGGGSGGGAAAVARTGKT